MSLGMYVANGMFKQYFGNGVPAAAVSKVSS
jgi:hypothetical protein